MPDENMIAEDTAAIAGSREKSASAGADKPASSSRRQSAASAQASRKDTVRKKHPAKANKYSAQEQKDKIRQIEVHVSDGKTTLKEAIHAVGISEQTFYRWRRAGAKVVSPVVSDRPRPAGAGGTLEDLIALEAENNRLRNLLAEKLREENSELRKRLGLG